MDLETLINNIREYEPELINRIFYFIFIDFKDKRYNFRNQYINILNESDIKGKNFFNNDYLKIIILGKNIKTIGEITFKNCSKLEDIVLNRNLESIKSKSFEGCKLLRKINLPHNLKYIGYKTFYGCESLKEVFLPKEIEYIGYNCFDECSSLTRVYMSNNTNYCKNTFPDYTQIIKY